MFKSSFTKYLMALTIIIMVGFTMLSGIIISIIRAHTHEDKEKKLEMASTIIAGHFEDSKIEDFESEVKSDFGIGAVAMFPLINLDYDFNMLVTDSKGNILLSTFGTTPNGMPITGGDIGVVNIPDFRPRVGENGSTYLVYEGMVEGVSNEKQLACGSAVVMRGEVKGYVFSLASLSTEDTLIGVTRRAVINGSIWVMMAALVAAYFITDRIVHPLKSMTVASKKFAKGDFSERIVVNGVDEVAELSVAFNNMAESLENLEKMRNTFLASVSHDLRTPMTTISGFIDGITSGAIPPEQQNHYLGVIQSEVHRLSRLVSQLLDVSRLDSGDRKFTFKNYNIAEQTRLLLLSFEQKIESKHLDAEFESEEDNMFACADEDAVHQVIYNLCHNALKFSVDGGKFAIKLSRAESKKIRISVYDDGQKITEEDASRIFERFYKSDKSRGLDKEGVGLGLYICKSIVDAHGGEIGVNVLESGCEFWFTVPEGEAVRRQAEVIS